MTETDIIKRFLASYPREFDFYQEAARLCAQKCELFLDTRGIRAIVTYRAKNPKSLQVKLEKRHEKKRYQTIEEIYEDLVDLAGVRIALYFPGKINEVDQLIRDTFNVQNVKLFPEQHKGQATIQSEASMAGIRLGLYFPANMNTGIESIQQIGKHPTNKQQTPKQEENAYKRIFSGYSARHYRVYMKYNEDLGRFNAARIEIQVASVLIHAWAEVEHDIIYKPQNDQLSEEEHAILDELNGLVLAGEIALNRLEKAAQGTSNKGNQPFRDHYVLASYIYDFVKKDKKNNKEPNMGRMDILYTFLQQIDKNNPQTINQYLNGLEPYDRSYSIDEQIIDKIIEGNNSYYNNYIDIIKHKNEKIYYFLNKKFGLVEEIIKSFMIDWIKIEKLLRILDNNQSPQKTLRHLLKELNIDDSLKNEINMLMNTRDSLLSKHSSRLMDIDKSTFYIETIKEVIEKIKAIIPEELQPRIKDI